MQGIEPVYPALACGFFTTEPPGEPSLTGNELNHSLSFPVSLCEPTGHSFKGAGGLKVVKKILSLDPHFKYSYELETI